MRTGIQLLMLVALCLAGCTGLPDEPDASVPMDGGLQPPDFWDPGDRKGNGCGGYGYGGDACPSVAVDCARDHCVHGSCVEEPNGSDYCQCEAGYAGTLCDACAAGYVADGLSCAPADPCAQSPCVHGTCRGENGAAICDCATGYAGAFCDSCAIGYHVENLQCVPD